jgi:hypothetical protein
MRKINIKSKKAVSEIIVTVILIGLGIGAVAIAGAVINNMLSGKMKETSTCYNLYDKVKLNKEYTCYRYDLSTKKYILEFSIGVDDVDIEGIKVAIKIKDGTTKSFDLTNQAKTITDLKLWNGSLNVFMPLKNSGFKYILSNLNNATDSITIAPIKDGKLCSESDSMAEIEICQIS